MTVLDVGVLNLARLIPWPGRASLVAREMRGMGCDLWFLTEAAKEKDLEKRLGGDWDIVSDKVNTTLLLRRDRLVPVGPASPIVMQGHGRKRYGNAVAVNQLATGITALAVVLHPSNTTEYQRPGRSKAQWMADANEGRKSQVRQALAVVAGRPEWRGLPTLLGGDLNDRDHAPKGVSHVLVDEHGFRDFNLDTDQPGRLDRLYGLNARCGRSVWRPWPKALTDHKGAAKYEVALSPATDPLEELLKVKGQIRAMSVSKLQRARSGRYLSRYTAVLQAWLSQPVTGVWTSKTQHAYEDFRRAIRPRWAAADVVGGPGAHSLRLIRDAAAKRGATTYPLEK